MPLLGTHTAKAARKSAAAATKAVTGAVSALLRHPASLLVAGLLAAYTALLLLLQGRLLSLVLLFGAGVGLALVSDNMTVVLLGALALFYTYLLLPRPRLMREGLADPGAAPPAALPPQGEEEKKQQQEGEVLEEADPPTAAEQKLDMLQSRLDVLQTSVDTLRPAVAAMGGGTTATRG